MLTNSRLPERLQRMRQAYFKIKPSISIQRALAHTRVAKEHAGLHSCVLRAKSIYHACQTAPIYIGEDELIVGLAGERPRAGIVSPDIAWRWIERELSTLHARKEDPYLISDQDKKILKEEIFPFWKGKSVDEKVYKNLEELNLLQMTYQTGIIDCEVKTQSGGGDLCPGYENILFKKGFAGIKKEAQQRLQTLHEEIPDQLEQIFFLKALVIVCDGMILLASRYSEVAAKMAQQEKNAKRKEELLTISKVLSRVPANPPTNFHEALQAIWFTQAMMYLEEISAGTSAGRVDQYVYPFYKADLENGRLTPEEAEELLYCFMYKFNENTWPLSAFASKYFSGYMAYQNITLGGTDSRGNDVTNELSYKIMECSKNLRMFQPSLSARVHKNSPKKYLNAVIDLFSAGLVFPNIQTDEISFLSLLSLGYSLEEARCYSVMSCTEPHIAGRLVRWASATYTNYGIPIEFVFTNGIHRASGKQLGLKTGPLDSFDTFEKFEAAIKEQFKYIIKICAITSLVVQKVHQDYPKILGSALIEGCLEKGKDWSNGGAFYNSGPGILCIGIAEYANSIYAIKKLVYQDKKITLQKLAQALALNFVGHPEILRMCRDVPKYGNDIDAVDFYAKDMIDFAYQEIRNHHTLFSKMELSTLSVSSNVPQGEVIGALPSGRQAGTPLPDGISPAQGTDTLGPTAAIKSVDKIDQWKSTDGVLYNMSLNPELLSTEKGRDSLIAMLKAHHQLGGGQIQFNCVKRETLLDAQKKPENYRSLMVRVAGYSAYFTELSPELQTDIISRTVQNSF